MITLEKVCFAYEHEVALRYVNLHIEKGESLVIQDRMVAANQRLQIIERDYFSIRRALFI